MAIAMRAAAPPAQQKAMLAEALIPLVNGASFHDAYGEGGLDRLAYALRVLAAARLPTTVERESWGELKENALESSD